MFIYIYISDEHIHIVLQTIAIVQLFALFQ